MYGVGGEEKRKERVRDGGKRRGKGRRRRCSRETMCRDKTVKLMPVYICVYVLLRCERVIDFKVLNNNKKAQQNIQALLLKRCLS